MQALVHYTLGGALVGVGATAVVDFWSIGRKHVFGISAPEYGLLGRWLAHMPDGRFRSYTRPESVGDARFPARAREALAQCAGIATRELDGVALLGCLQFERHSGSREQRVRRTAAGNSKWNPKFRSVATRSANRLPSKLGLGEGSQ
jgi:hypothetical protein